MTVRPNTYARADIGAGICAVIGALLFGPVGAAIGGAVVGGVGGLTGAKLDESNQAD